MKPTEILNVLDLALKIRNQGRTFNPLFAGDAGIGKSEICQQWVKEQRKKDPDFGFVDLRLAFFDAPDLVGIPDKVTENGKRRTVHFLPDFYPEPGSRGLLLLEEPNRAPNSIMNAIMQLLTDRKVHHYSLPDGWIIAGAINDGVNYDVNTMDTALKDRFVVYNVEYDFKTFLDFMKEKEWSSNVRNFVESGLWTYKRPDEIGEQGSYIAPRTWARVNAVEMAEISDTNAFHYNMLAILGDAVGREYYKFRFEQTPVTAQDFVKSEKEALKKLKNYCGDNYRGDMVEVTINSLTEAFPKIIKLATIIKVAKLLPKDQAATLLLNAATVDAKLTKGESTFTLKELIEKDPELKEALTGGLRKTGPSKKKETKDVSDEI